MTSFQAHGVDAALRDLGVKYAGKTFIDADGRKATFGASAKSHIARSLLGKPGEYLSDIREGRLFAPGTYSRAALWPSAPLPRGAGLLARLRANVNPLLYYLPALVGAAGAAAAPAEQKGEAWGGVIGSTAGTMLGAPLGLLGTLGLSELGRRLGARAGSSFDSANSEAYYHPPGESDVVV